jgi:hypothetical protein
MTSEALRRLIVWKRADPFQGILPDGEKIIPIKDDISSGEGSDIFPDGGE